MPSEFTVLDKLISAINALNNILPKKTVPHVYVDMIRVAADFALAEVNDELSNRRRFGMKIDQEVMARLLKSRFEFHIKNQIELYKSQK